MTSRHARIAFLTLLLAPWTFAAAAETPPVYSVGVAAVDITPDFPIRLNGFLVRSGESTGVRQRIWAKALAIGTNDRDAVVILTVDTLGIPDEIAENVSQKLKESFSLPRERLAITATHTHSAPVVRGCANLIFGGPIPDGEWDRILKYTAEFEAKLVRAATESLQNRKPSRLSWGVGKVTFAKNRRTPNGPVDHDLPVLAAHGLDGKLRAILTTYATHCVNLSDDQINGDWAGYAMEHIQRLHPGCEALISIGCGADSNPVEGVVKDRVEIPDRHGLEIAQEVERLLAAGLTPLSQPPAARFERITLPLAPLRSRTEWETLAQEQSPAGYYARTQLARLDRGEKLTDAISYPVQSIAFGNELAMVFLPGEVVVDYALRLKSELDGRRLWMNAYSNSCPGYVPSERILREGGYEGGQAMIYYDIPAPYAAGLEQKIVDAVRRQLDDRFAPTVDARRTQGIPPKSPSQALATMRVKPGFRVELVAAEPLVQSPVAINFGPDGRLWVAEMWDYPSGVTGRYEPGGRVRCLHDDDGDGRYDRAEIFLEGIPFPTGVTPWRNGLLVCAAPDILYAEDADADGKADVVRKLFSGFATHNFHGRVNSLEYGLDGWVYGSCGLFGGSITSHRANAVIPLGGRDFRLNPDTGELEAVTGTTQQGRVRNDWGDWFGCNNSQLLLHYPLEDRYLRRNPFLQPPSTVVGINAGPDPGRLFPVSQQVLFELSGPPNRPTAACGVGVYRDDLLGSDCSGNVFTCEPVNNLVHRQILSPRGATFASRRGDDELDREFLASTDPWFRPVQARTGLDGGLWIVDMYRYVIEHPIWIPPETLSRLDVRAGADMGRIYRIVPENAPRRVVPRLDRLDAEHLVAALDVPNGPQRDLVQQMLLWRQDRGAIPALKSLALTSSRPETRMQSLCAWAGLEQPDDEALRTALGDAHPGVRRQAVRLSEGRWNDSPALAAAATRLADDPDPSVRMQVAYSLGTWNHRDAAKRLAELLLRDADDPYLRAAVESSLTSRNVTAVLKHLQSRSGEKRVSVLLDRVFAQAAALANAEDARTMLQTLCRAAAESPSPPSLRRLAGFLDAWSRRERTDLDLPSPSVRTIWEPAIAQAATIAADESSALELRLAAVQLLGQSPALGTSHADLLAGLLSPRSPTELQSAAVAALGRDSGSDVPEMLLADWASHPPAQRRDIVALLLSRPAWTKALIAALEQQTLSVAEFDLSQQQLLLNHADGAIRAAASRSFQSRAASSRQDVIDRYAAALRPQGDAGRGKELFQKHCSVCHRVHDVGHVVGPDLLPYSGKPAQALLIALFDPNQAVEPRYQTYAVSFDDGRTASGLVIDETSAGFTLLAAEAKRVAVLRSEIDELRNTGKSLMPEGFEQRLGVDDVSDLWAYIRTWRLPSKSLPGNEPALVEIKDSRGAALPAAKAEIYGGDITFETPFKNIGYWHHRDDFVRWRISSPALFEFEVWCEWACAPDAAGNAFRLEGADPVLTGQVPSTGGWDKYQFHRIGTIRLQAGESELILRPGGEVRRALADVRAVHLVAPDTVPEAAGRVEPATDAPTDPADVAAYLLDDQRPQGEREKLIPERLDHASEIISHMAQGLPPEAGSKEEYRRIPWIWRVAIAAAKTKDAARIRNILQVSLPEGNARLEHWQAVVIGGGVINGVSLAGEFPSPAIRKIIGDDRTLRQRWDRALKLAAAMADDEQVSTGTRYDALRMIAMLGWDASQAQLQKYLERGVHDELQMGAISGMSDIEHDDVAAALLKGLGHYSEENRGLALDALLRTDARCRTLLKGIAEKKVSAKDLGPERVKKLRTHPMEDVRKQAEALLKP